MRCGDCGGLNVTLQDVRGESFPYKSHSAVIIDSELMLNKCNDCGNILVRAKGDASKIDEACEIALTKSRFTKDSIASRQKINREIVNALSEMVEKYPNMRMGQFIHTMLPDWRKEGVASAEVLGSLLYNEEPALHLIRLFKYYEDIKDDGY